MDCTANQQSAQSKSSGRDYSHHAVTRAIGYEPETRLTHRTFSTRVIGHKKWDQSRNGLKAYPSTSMLTQIVITHRIFWR